MTPHNYEIVDCGAFCEVIFFCISPKNLLGDFFDSLSCNPCFRISSGDTIFLMEINKEKLNRKRGWMDKKNGENLPHSKLKNRHIADNIL